MYSLGLKNDAGYGLFEVLDRDADLPLKGDVYVGGEIGCHDSF